MKKVVLALGMSLGALSLVACEAKQDEVAAVETDTATAPQVDEVAPAPVTNPDMIVDGATAPADAAENAPAEEATGATE